MRIGSRSCDRQKRGRRIIVRRPGRSSRSAELGEQRLRFRSSAGRRPRAALPAGSRARLRRRPFPGTPSRGRAWSRRRATGRRAPTASDPRTSALSGSNDRSSLSSSSAAAGPRELRRRALDGGRRRASVGSTRGLHRRGLVGVVEVEVEVELAGCGRRVDLRRRRLPAHRVRAICGRLAGGHRTGAATAAGARRRRRRRSDDSASRARSCRARASAPARMSAGDCRSCAPRRRRDRDLLVDLHVERGVGVRRGSAAPTAAVRCASGDRAAARGAGAPPSANIGLFGIELAAERHGLLPDLALALASPRRARRRRSRTPTACCAARGSRAA